MTGIYVAGRFHLDVFTIPGDTENFYWITAEGLCWSPALEEKVIAAQPPAAPAEGEV